ncbi:MAG: response regulator [Deltaproteobacteria bacterium]|nr:response regulator [Deltaproteobacteria bacterium]
MLKIMVVDDDYVISEELKEALLGLEYDVVGVVSSGAAAVEMAPEVNPDVILMDIVMPGGMDGTEATEIVMGLTDCAVVFVTGYGDDEIVERAKNVEPHGYLLKPFEPAEVKAVIEIAFHKKQFENRLKKA